MATDRANMPSDEGPAWWDHEAGPVVRPYMVTGGRTEPTSADFDLISHVVATTSLAAETPSPEHQAILGLTQEPRSVAEVAASADARTGLGVSRQAGRARAGPCPERKRRPRLRL